MKYNSIETPWQIVGDSALGTLVLGIVSYLGYLCHLNLSMAGFVCLVVVPLSSLGSMVSSTIHSIVTVACLDFFFAVMLLGWPRGLRRVLVSKSGMTQPI